MTCKWLPVRIAVEVGKLLYSRDWILYEELNVQRSATLCNWVRSYVPHVLILKPSVLLTSRRPKQKCISISLQKQPQCKQSMKLEAVAHLGYHTHSQAAQDSNCHNPQLTPCEPPLTGLLRFRKEKVTVTVQNATELKTGTVLDDRTTRGR